MIRRHREILSSILNTDGFITGNELVNYLRYKINLYGCYTYQQFIYIDTEALEKIDFVVSTSTLADKTDIPFVQINPIIEKKDITNISAYIDYITKNK